MFTKSPSQQAFSPTPAVIPGKIEMPQDNGSPLLSEPKIRAERVPETRGRRLRRKAHRGRLHGYALVAVAVLAFLIALAVLNTAHVKVSWVFGSSHVALVWMVLFAAILGWLLGILTSTAFHWRTRAHRYPRG